MGKCGFAEKRNGANDEQWFSIGGDFSPMGYLAMPGYTFDCHKWR